MMKVKTFPQCQQAFSTTAAGLELLYSHLIQKHQLAAEAAGDAVDRATIKDRPEILPVPLLPLPKISSGSDGKTSAPNRVVVRGYPSLKGRSGIKLR
jgi:hypothetical protein